MRRSRAPPVAVLSARLDAPEEPTFKTDLKRDARRIRNIVEQLLAISRLGARPDANFEEIDLVETGRAIVSDALLLAYRSGRQIEFIGSDGTVFVRGDRLAVESIISNVVENALRAEPTNGTVIVAVGDDATIAVSDHGEGVASDEREMIFEPFWRKGNSAEGTGLGLAIAKALMNVHNGRIWAEDTPGGGATFKLLIPLHSAKQPSASRATSN